MSPVARSTDPETSHAAAASVTGVTESQRALARLLAQFGPMTDEQLVARHVAIAKAAKGRWLSPSGVRTRRAELVAAGIVRDSGQRAMLATGRRAIVWELVG